MEDLLLLVPITIIYLSYKNGVMARERGKRPFLWAILTFAAYLLFYSIGAMILLIMLSSSGQLKVGDVQDTPEYRDALTTQVTQLMSANPMNIVMVVFLGFGGCLLVRYILEKTPVINIPKDTEGGV